MAVFKLKDSNSFKRNKTLPNSVSAKSSSVISSCDYELCQQFWGLDIFNGIAHTIIGIFLLHFGIVLH